MLPRTVSAVAVMSPSHIEERNQRVLLSGPWVSLGLGGQAASLDRRVRAIGGGRYSGAWTLAGSRLNRTSA